VNGTWRVSTGPGSHSLAISGLAFNCDVTAAPSSAMVTVGATTRVEVRASCKPYLRDAIIYTSEEFTLSEVMVMRPDGSRRERLTTDQVAYAAPVVSPDGQSIAVASHVGGSWNGIYLLDRFGKGRTKLVGRSTFDGTPAWSPDGTKLAFRSMRPSPVGDYSRIFVVNRDGSGLRQLTPETTEYTNDESASWSPDGTRLVFSRDGVLFVINADGTGLTSLGVSGQYPALSPDGTQVAYHTFVDGILTLFVASADGSNARRLTTPVEGDQMARWSPDGLQLVFQRSENRVLHLYTIGADGSGEVKLTTGTHHESWASWSPDF
jgi:Tol biopolymer transport system component